MQPSAQTARTREETERAIFHDLELCSLGLAFTKGSLRRQYAKHRKACLAALHQINVDDGLAVMTIDKILAELEA